MDELLRLVSALFSNGVSAFFSIMILTYFFLSLFFINNNSTKIKSIVNGAAANLATFGILGTFFGVFLGLIDFDVRNINKSVPELLEGLKVAFGTSILGISCSVLFKIFRPLIHKSVAEEDSGGKEIVESLNKIQKTLSDENDKSLIGQLERLRGSVADLDSTTKHGFEAQIKEFKDFSEQISKSFSEAIIEQLKNVIKDFNEKISEQFGDNFKQLNNAVGKLLEWQENYKNQMEQMKTSLDNSIISIGKTKESIEKIEQSSLEIPKHMDKLDGIGENINSRLNKLTESAQLFADIQEKASNAFPIINKNIDDITTTFKETLKTQSSSVDSITKNFENLYSENKHLQEELKGSYSEFKSKFDETLSSINTELTKSLQEHRESNTQMIDGVQQAFNETIQNATNKLNDSVTQLDDAIQKELEAVLRVMAENLSGITQKFVNDYNPLLQTMKNIVEVGQKAKE